MFRSQGSVSLEKKFDLFLEKHIKVVVPPRSTESGYVYTNLDPGAKAFAVELIGDRDIRSFEYVQAVPGFEADFMRVAFDQLYTPEEVRDLYMLNPVSCAVEIARDVIIRAQLPPLGMTVYYTTFCLVMFVIGLLVFTALQKRIAKHL